MACCYHAMQWGMTPLILAAKNGNKTSAKILVDNGADVNAESKEVHTYMYCVMYASFNLITFQ